MEAETGGSGETPGLDYILQDSGVILAPCQLLDLGFLQHLVELLLVKPCWGSVHPDHLSQRWSELSFTWDSPTEMWGGHGTAHSSVPPY